jgi:hypothetical protein
MGHQVPDADQPACAARPKQWNRLFQGRSFYLEVPYALLAVIIELASNYLDGSNTNLFSLKVGAQFASGGPALSINLGRSFTLVTTIETPGRNPTPASASCALPNLDFHPAICGNYM